MKKTRAYAAFFLAFVAGLSGCSKVDSPPGVAYPPLVGTWELVLRNVPNDTSFTTKRIEDSSAQTLTFNDDGNMSSTGQETSYYRSSRAYRVDSTRRGWQIGFIPGDIFAAFYQNFILKADSLTLLPCPGRECDLVFVKSR